MGCPYSAQSGDFRITVGLAAKERSRPGCTKVVRQRYVACCTSHCMLPMRRVRQQQTTTGCNSQYSSTYSIGSSAVPDSPVAHCTRLSVCSAANRKPWQPTAEQRRRALAGVLLVSTLSTSGVGREPIRLDAAALPMVCSAGLAGWRCRAERVHA